MTDSAEAKIDRGHFRWNVGAWFGSVVGGTAWMILAGGFLMASDQWWVATAPLACFLITNMVALWLWRKRDRTPAFRAYMILMSVLAIAVPLTWFSIVIWGPTNSLEQMTRLTSSAASISVLLLVPAMMAWFCFLEYYAMRRTLKNSNGIEGTK